MVKINITGVVIVVVVIITAIIFGVVFLDKGHQPFDPNPALEFSGTYFTENSTLIIIHEGGDPIQKESTEFFIIEVEGNETVIRKQFNSSSDKFPITKGDKIVLRDPSLSDGQKVSIFWVRSGLNMDKKEKLDEFYI